ncbi:phospholipase D-like domain-containing protein [Marinicella gelatinilytica]|uniref:phospholipase D-like domain-containing protein n=1 Tax=Marinicella gelatinilytica TaxID=2996017 RepID=UPI002260E908|nr:phospholipase D family protein [Marinicella gelatinilytica]MCX7545637.1 phospholipase D family protein [Marinicella gelatinilytica]
MPFLLVIGCQIDRQTLRQAETVTELKKDTALTCPIKQVDTCAADTAFNKLYAKSQMTDKNQMLILDHGEKSLLARINLIRAAQKSIDIQTFIWNNDEAGNWVLSELVKAARRGVQVSIIGDQLYTMGNSWLMAELATLHENFDFRLYNPVFSDAHTSTFEFATAIACCLANLNRRMHNKAFVVDDRYAIVGGRNYSSRYFDWDGTFNYKDREVMAIGSVVNEIVVSFDSFWTSPHVLPLTHLNDVARRIINNEEAQTDWNRPLPKLAKTLSAQANDNGYIEKTFFADFVAVDEVEYFSDTHDKPFNKEARIVNKQLTDKFHDLFSKTEHHLVIQTPYLVFSRKARKMFKTLRKEHPDLILQVSTNSLSSTDAFYVYAISLKYKRFYLKKLGMEIYEFKQRPGMLEQFFATEQSNEHTRYGMHSKSFVIDDKISMIGSHNFDPRSDVLNTESGFIIYDREFAAKLTASIEQDMLPENSWLVAAKEQIPFFSHVSGFFATISRKLPIFDIWPFRYSTSYELLPGKEPVPRDHPDFFEHYEEVGNFPDIDLPVKQIQTIIISAFGGFAEPIM